MFYYIITATSTGTKRYTSWSYTTEVEEEEESNRSITYIEVEAEESIMTNELLLHPALRILPVLLLLLTSVQHILRKKKCVLRPMIKVPKKTEGLLNHLLLLLRELLRSTTKVRKTKMNHRVSPIELSSLSSFSLLLLRSQWSIAASNKASSILSSSLR